MHCLDCRTTGSNSPCVGVCQRCGAGVCAEHARIATHSVRRGPLIGTPAEAEARTVLCPLCAATEAPTAAAPTPAP
ncbi:DUF2180 family protein [Streptomyces sp. NPDC048392]|uniref:DUF2180 family protein n=1 Tax=Streptomyces sp. NPDC048392 TaxID=3365543 RepID=UPI003722469C